MKILRVIASLNPTGGGPSEGVRRIDAVLNRLGHITDVVTLDSPNNSGHDYPGQVFDLGPSFGGYGYNPRIVRWLRENAKNYDAVVVNGIWQYHSFAAWRALAGGTVPYFVYTHGMLDPWFKKNYPIKHLKKCLYWPWADYRVLRDAAGVLFTCEEEMLLAPQSFSLYSAKAHVVKYGSARPPENTTEIRSAFLDLYPDLRNKRLLLYLGRIHEKKGCDILIEAFSRIAHLDENVVLIMAGPDQTGLGDKLREVSRLHGVEERVRWPGMLQGNVKWGAFYSSELFVLPSHQENFGIAVAEALACSLPVLISNKVNIWREINEDGVGLVGNDDLVDTENNLRLWISMASERRMAMSKQASVTYEERYTVEQMANSLVEVISKTISV